MTFIFALRDFLNYFGHFAYKFVYLLLKKFNVGAGYNLGFAMEDFSVKKVDVAVKNSILELE